MFFLFVQSSLQSCSHHVLSLKLQKGLNLNVILGLEKQAIVYNSINLWFYQSFSFPAWPIRGSSARLQSQQKITQAGIQAWRLNRFILPLLFSVWHSMEWKKDVGEKTMFFFHLKLELSTLPSNLLCSFPTGWFHLTQFPIIALPRCSSSFMSHLFSPRC